MTTSDAADGRMVWYVKFCPVGREARRDYAWDKSKWGYTKDEVITKFTEHLYCAHSIVSDRLMQSICDDLEFVSYFDHGAEDPPTPPMPPSAVTPKQPAMPPPSVKNEPAENASSSSKRRKVEPPDEPPAPEPDEATVEIGRNDMAALMHATRLFAVTMDDAVATLGEAAATMSNFYRRAKSSESGDICCDRIIEK